MAEFNFNSTGKKINKLGKSIFYKYRKKEKKSLILKDVNNLKAVTAPKSYRDKSQLLEKTNSSLFELKNGFNIEEYLSNTYEEMDYETRFSMKKEVFGNISLKELRPNIF